MDQVIEGLLADVKVGQGERRGATTLLPVTAILPNGPEYLVLSQAMSAGVLEITEVDSGGHVPSLVATNNGGLGVLILDGEELVGAKQNRVLNTTVFIAPGQQVVIPVSCVEQGRWHYNSHYFMDSGHYSAHRVRSETQRSVTVNTRMGRDFVSDQGAVWGAVSKLAADEGVLSPTCAMRDVYEHCREKTEIFAADVELVKEQRGLIAVAAGRVIGFDLVSRQKAYAMLHEKLVRSYSFGAQGDGDTTVQRDAYAAKNFLVGLCDATASALKSPGTGTAYRYSGPGVVGSSLLVDEAVVHAAFFGIDGDGEAEQPTDHRSARMASSLRRVEFSRRLGGGPGE